MIARVKRRTIQLAGVLALVASLSCSTADQTGAEFASAGRGAPVNPAIPYARRFGDSLARWSAAET